MSDTVKKSISQPPATLQSGCEIIIPITLKVRILIQPEVLGMPPICHLQLQQIEPEAESCPLPIPTDTNQDLCGYNQETPQEVPPTNTNQEVYTSSLEVLNTAVEINVLSSRQEPTWRHWWAKLKSFMINSEERKKRILQHINRSSNLSQSLLATSSNSEVRKKQIMKHIQTNSN